MWIYLRGMFRQLHYQFDYQITALLSIMYLKPDTMTINGKGCKDKQLIADQFNSFSAALCELNKRNSRKHNGSHFKDYLTSQTDCRFSFNTIDNTETLRIIKNIKISHYGMVIVYLTQHISIHI